MDPALKTAARNVLADHLEEYQMVDMVCENLQGEGIEVSDDAASQISDWLDSIASDVRSGECPA